MAQQARPILCGPGVGEESLGGESQVHGLGRGHALAPGPMGKLRFILGEAATLVAAPAPSERRGPPAGPRNAAVALAMKRSSVACTASGEAPAPCAGVQQHVVELDQRRAGGSGSLS